MIKEYTCDRTNGELIEHEGNIFDCKFNWKRTVRVYPGNHFEEATEDNLSTELEIISIELSTAIGGVAIVKGSDRYKELVDVVQDWAIQNEEQV